MNEEIKILYDEKKVLVSSQVLEKIKYLTREDIASSREKDSLINEMHLSEFYKRKKSIIQRSENIIECLPYKDNEINYNTDLIYSLAQKYNELYPEEKRELGHIDDEMFYELLIVIYQLNIEINQFYLIRDLIYAKEDCIKNMKYFLDDVTIFQFNDEYEKAIQSKDIKKMSDMLNYVQQAILKEWEKYFASMDSMTDDNFSFIGHSVRSSEFNGDFYSKYVSNSLFNQDLTDTYMAGYGFIFSPKNIVGANSQDMYTNNYVEDEDILLTFSIIKKIDHPQRLIDECIKLKQENVENNKNKKVYNEVIIEGFDPIGIFCFTDGSKNLNSNYRNAQQLQKSFPHLKIYNFDIMKVKKGAELDKIKLSLLNDLRTQFAKQLYISYIDIDMLPRFDYFFEEYEKLKQKGQYTEEEIVCIFKNNVNLLSIFNTRPDDLFNGMYDEKQIKYILGKNITYNIDYILSGKAKAFALNDLKVLYPYRDKLNSMYDGLSEFLDLVSRMEITDEMMLEINNNESINFYTITKVLASKMIEQANQNINNYQVKYNELQKELQKRTIIQEQYDYYYPIYLNMAYTDMIKKDHINIIDDINVIEQKDNELHIELSEIESDLNKIEEKIKLLENSICDDNVEYIYCKKKLIEIKKNVSELSKHPFINRKRIKEEKNKLKVFEEKEIIERSKFESLKSEESSKLESEKNELQLKKDMIKSNLSSIQTEKNRLFEQLDTLKSKVKVYFKCESVDEIDLVISKTENFMSQYDRLNSYYLSKINSQLEELTNMIIDQQTSLNDIKTTVSRSL